MAYKDINIRSTFDASGVTAAQKGISQLSNSAKGVSSTASGLSKVTNTLGTLIKTGGSASGSLGGVVANLGGLSSGAIAAVPAIGAITMAIVGLRKGVMSCVHDFAEAEVVSARFTNTLGALNLKQYTYQFEEFARVRSELTGETDENIQSAIQYGLQMGIQADQIQRVVTVAQDMSATFGISLQSAVSMLGKSSEGYTKQLTALVPALGESIKEGMSFSDVLGVMEERTGGAAEAIGDTYQGSLMKLKNAFSDLKEGLGKHFTPALTDLYNILTKIVLKISEVFGFNKQTVQIEKGEFTVDKGIKVLKQKQKQAKNQDTIVNGVEMTATEALALLELMKKYGVSFHIAMEAQELINRKKLEEADAIEKAKKMIENLGKTNPPPPPNPNPAPTTAGEPVTTTSTYMTHYKESMQQLIDAINTAGEENAEAYGQEQEQANIDANAESDAAYYMQVYKESTAAVLAEERIQREKDRQQDNEKFSKLKENIGGFLGVDLSSIEGFFMSILSQTESFQALGDALQPLIQMLDGVLKPILAALGPLIATLFDSLKPVLAALMPPLMVVVAVITNVVTALMGFSKMLYYIITLQWNKISSISFNFTSIESAIAAGNAAASDIMNINTNPFANLSTQNAASNSYSASAARDIYITIEYNNSYVNGDAREIALNIRNEIRLAEAMGL